MAHLVADTLAVGAELGTRAVPRLIEGEYSVDLRAPLAGAGAGQPAYVARGDRAGPGFMAVQVEPGWPIRARVLTTLAPVPIRQMLTPMAHGPAPVAPDMVGYFVICAAAPGPSLAVDL